MQNDLAYWLALMPIPWWDLLKVAVTVALGMACLASSHRWSRFWQINLNTLGGVLIVLGLLHLALTVLAMSTERCAILVRSVL